MHCTKANGKYICHQAIMSGPCEYQCPQNYERTCIFSSVGGKVTVTLAETSVFMLMMSGGIECFNSEGLLLRAIDDV